MKRRYLKHEHIGKRRLSYFINQLESEEELIWTQHHMNRWNHMLHVVKKYCRRFPQHKYYFSAYLY